MYWIEKRILLEGNRKVYASAQPCINQKGAMTAMATLDDNWQTKRPTISKRTKFIFNNELLSDVKLVVPASLNESESKKSQKCMHSSSQVYSCNKQSCVLCHVLR